MPLSPERVIGGYQGATASIRKRVLAYTAAVWANSPAFRDSDIDRIVARILPVIQAGQMQLAQLTDTYIGHMSVLAGVTWTSGVDRSLLDYRGVPAAEVYRRPAVQTYTALSKGSTLTEALKAGASRLQSIVATDLQQAVNRQSQRSYSGSGFSYTLRVLSGAENCALCVIASTQRYHRGELMPIHPGCDCEQRGVKAGSDPGQVINPDLLELTHAEIDKRLGGSDRGARDLGIGKTTSAGNPISDYTDLTVVNDHGELGPTLGWRSDKFTSADDIAALAH